MSDDAEDDVVARIAEETGESEELIERTLDVQQAIKRDGITGIRFMGKAGEKAQKVGPMMAKRNAIRELKKRLGK
jgi:hypothetical protein